MSSEEPYVTPISAITEADFTQYHTKMRREFNRLSGENERLTHELEDTQEKLVAAKNSILKALSHLYDSIVKPTANTRATEELESYLKSIETKEVENEPVAG